MKCLKFTLVTISWHKYDANCNYHPQTKFAKVMFLHLSVSHSVHGGGGPASVHAGIPPRTRHPREQTPPSLGADIPPPGSSPMLGDMVNKWAVRILLECNLVFQLLLQLILSDSFLVCPLSQLFQDIILLVLWE